MALNGLRAETWASRPVGEGPRGGKGRFASHGRRAILMTWQRQAWRRFRPRLSEEWKMSLETS